MKNILFAAVLISLLVATVLFAQAPKSDTSQAPQVKPAEGGTVTVAVLETKLGKIVIRFFPEKAPNHVKNFENLVKTGFYDNTKFHRVIPGFMIQGGDPNTKQGNPNTWGTGGNTDKVGREINVKAEFNDIHHIRGIVSMARAANPNSASSQFFICVADVRSSLDNQYSAFGQIVEGMDVVDKIVNAPRDTSNDRPKAPTAIDKAYLEERPADKKLTAAPPTK
jgi:peptidyl-prolyl cis-trans isomerase B (cyclophilin B)